MVLSTPQHTPVSCTTHPKHLIVNNVGLEVTTNCAGFECLFRGDFVDGARPERGPSLPVMFS